MTDNSWELPDGADQAPPQVVADPAPVAESPALPEPAPSAVPEPFPAPPVFAAGRPGVNTAGVVRVIGAALLIVGGLCLAAFLLPHAGRQPMYDVWEVDALFGLQSIAILAAAGMLFARKTQDLATGLVLGAIPLWFADEISAFRPTSLLAANLRASSYFFLAAAVCFLPGAILVLLSVVVGRPDKPAGARRPSRAARRSRLIVLLAGVVAAALFATGRFMNWAVTTITFPAAGGTTQPPVHSPCCAIGDVSGWTKADYLVAAAVLLGVAVAAPVMRSRLTGAGLLFGAGFFLFSGLAETVVAIAWPLRSNAALAQVVAVEHLTVSVGPVTGLWVAAGGVLLVAATGVLRLTLAAGRTRYPEPPVVVPVPAQAKAPAAS